MRIRINIQPVTMPAEQTGPEAWVLPFPRQCVQLPGCEAMPTSADDGCGSRKAELHCPHCGHGLKIEEIVIEA